MIAYSTLRPVGPGTYGKEGVIRVENFDKRKYVEQIGDWAWGRIVYDHDLAAEELDRYDLKAATDNDAIILFEQAVDAFRKSGCKATPEIAEIYADYRKVEPWVSAREFREALMDECELRRREGI